MSQSSSFNFYIGQTLCKVSYIATSKTIKKTYQRHKHTSFEFHYMIKGSCSVLIKDQYVDMHQGEILLIAPNLYHSVKNFSPDFHKLCFNFDFSTNDKKKNQSEINENLTDGFRDFETLLLPAQTQENLLASILKSHNKSLSSLETEELKAHLTLLFLWIIKQMQKKLISPQSGNSNLIDNNTILEFFNMNFHMTNGMDLLAKKLHVSRRHLERIIKKEFGKGYREMIGEIRLEIATDLLRTTDKTISEISEIVGYSNPAGFISFIKKMTGMTPLQYRKQIEKNFFRI